MEAMQAGGAAAYCGAEVSCGPPNKSRSLQPQKNFQLRRPGPKVVLSLPRCSALVGPQQPLAAFRYSCNVRYNWRRSLQKLLNVAWPCLVFVVTSPTAPAGLVLRYSCGSCSILQIALRVFTDTLAGSKVMPPDLGLLGAGVQAELDFLNRQTKIFLFAARELRKCIPKHPPCPGCILTCFDWDCVVNLGLLGRQFVKYQHVFPKPKQASADGWLLACPV
jgi:hypothetical protein